MFSSLSFRSTLISCNNVFRVHTGVVIGKAISKQFYGKSHTKSYYLGCSTGGRQGLKSVQDFPEDFDGVIAGAPANAFSGLLSWSGRHYGITGPPGSESFITEEQWKNLVHPDIMEQCDTIDGVADGVIEDPNLCDYKPERLICSSNVRDKSKCLSGGQARAIRKIFSPLYSPEGELWFPRQQPGSEDASIIAAMYSGKPFPFTVVRIKRSKPSHRGSRSHYARRIGSVIVFTMIQNSTLPS